MRATGTSRRGKTRQDTSRRAQRQRPWYRPLTLPRGYKFRCQTNDMRIAFGRYYTCCMLRGAPGRLFSALEVFWRKHNVPSSCRYMLLEGVQKAAGCLVKLKCLLNCSHGFASGVLGRSWAVFGADHENPEYVKFERCLC